MKRVSSLVVVVALIVSMFSCSSVLVSNTSPGHSGTAPGQVKKQTGSQSAAPYAPGQQKKKK